MAKNKAYVVFKGKTAGIYTDWDSCSANVYKVDGAIYKGYATLEAAEDAWEEFKKNGTLPYGGEKKSAIATPKKESVKSEKKEDKGASQEEIDAIVATGNYAFVDGSFNSTTDIYGYGGFVICNGEKHIVTGSGEDEEMASMRNVAGEILGSQAAIEKAIELGMKEVTILYDYKGIEHWADGSWKRNKTGTMKYHDFIQSIKNQISVRFVKVAAHTGIDGNEEADRLAKEACGVEE